MNRKPLSRRSGEPRGRVGLALTRILILAGFVGLALASQADDGDDALTIDQLLSITSVVSGSPDWSERDAPWS